MQGIFRHHRFKAANAHGQVSCYYFQNGSKLVCFSGTKLRANGRNTSGTQSCSTGCTIWNRRSPKSNGATCRRTTIMLHRDGETVICEPLVPESYPINYYSTLFISHLVKCLPLFSMHWLISLLCP